ncbi:hypothetical protein Tco_0785944 [Tanacetum coccineum]
MKDEAGGNLNEEENDFMLDNAYGDDTLKEQNAVVIMMARIQPAENKADAEPKHDAETISELNSSQINPISGIGTNEHDSYAHDQSVALESLIYNVQNEAKNQRRLNNELNNKKALLQKELETCKERVKNLEKKPVQSLDYKEAYEELEQKIHVDKDKIDNLIKEKDKIQDEFFQLENATVRIRHETELSKKAFKARENKYLEDIVYFEKKLNSHDRIVYKMGQLIQPIYMLGKKPNKVYDPFLKAGLGYQNPKRLKRAINQDLSMTISELKAKLKLAEKEKNVNTKFNKSATLEKLIRSKPVTSCSTSKNKQRQKTNANVIARGMYRIIKIETKTPVDKTNKFSCNSTRVASSSSFSRSKSKDTNSKKRVLLNTKSKRTSKDVKKSQRVKRALFTSLIATKSSKLGDTPVVAKSRFSVATTPKETDMVSRASPLTPESRQSQTLSTYMKNKIKISRKWQKWFVNQSCFNWSPKSSNAKTPPHVSKSSASHRTNSKTPVTTQKWVAKLPTPPSEFVSCDAVPELTIAKTNELIKEAIPRMVNDAIIEELFKIHMKNKVLNVHPTTSISTTKITVDLKPQLYLKMKSDLHAQATDPEM